MTDTVKSWIEERRNIKESAHLSEVGAALAHEDGLDMFPRALDALSKVLELHCSASTYQNVSECENEDEDHEDERHTESEDGIPICLDLPDYTACLSCQVGGEPVEWPCPTVQAVQTAIEGGR